METTVHRPAPELQTVSVELLGKPIHIVRENLETILQSSCHLLSNALQNWLKTNQIDTKLKHVELYTLRLDEMEKDRTSTFRHQDGGLAYVHTDAATLIKLADLFYGASLERNNLTLTNSDVRLQERLGKQITGWVAPADMWQPCDFTLGQGMGLRSVFEIRIGNSEITGVNKTGNNKITPISGELTIDFDSTLVNTLIDQLGLCRPADLSDAFNRSLASTPVRLNVLLSKKTLPLSDVLHLAPNDILPIDLLSTVPVSIGNEHLFNGRIAEQDGQLVLILNHNKDA